MAEDNHLRILFIGYGQHGTTFLTRLVRGLADAGNVVTLARPERGLPTKLQHHNINNLWAPSWHERLIPRMLNLIILFLMALFGRRVRWLLMQIKNQTTLRDKLVAFYRLAPFCQGHWDLVYFPWNSAAIDYRALYALGKPVVLSCRGSQVNIRPHQPGQDDFVQGLQWTFQNSAAVHCVSEDILNQAVSMGLDRRKAHVIRPAVDPAFFSPSDMPPGNVRFNIVTTGSLIWPKAYESMLMALNILILSGVDAELHIIGEGPERSRILFTCQDLDVADRVCLHGSLTPPQVRDRLQAADAFVLASLSEGIANAVLEAMSCGLPVVTTDCGGMREAVADGVEGFVVPVRDPQAMAGALVRLARDPLLRKRMGAAGRQCIDKAFHIDGQIDAFIELFQAVAQDSQAGTN